MVDNSAKKVILDALAAETPEEASIGKSPNPVIPLFGSTNVDITEKEEKECE